MLQVLRYSRARARCILGPGLALRVRYSRARTSAKGILGPRLGLGVFKGQD